MLAIKKILAPVDFTERSNAAAAHAAQLACRFDAELVLVHVRPGEVYPTAVPVGAESRDKAELIEARRAAGKLRALGDEIWPDGRIHRIDCEGDPATRIVHLALEQQPDLIVMATHGAGPFRRFLVGSVTQKTLHDTQCPVLTGVHLEDAKTFAGEDYKRIACAVGLKDLEHSKTVLRAAADWAQAFGAELDVLHAPSPTEVSMWEGFPLQSVAGVEAERRTALRKLLNELGVEAQVHVATEDPVSYLSRMIPDLGVDLLITGRSVRSGILHWPHGDAFGIIRESPVAVLSV